MFNINKLFAKMVICLHDDKNAGFTDTAKTQSNEEIFHYLSLSYFPMVILEINDKNVPWDRKSKIVMTSKNQLQLITGLKKAINILYRKDTYYYDNGTLCLGNITETEITRVYNAGESNKLVIIPNIVSDTDTNQYEGVRIFINDTSVFVDLTIDEIESLVYSLEKIDLFLYSQGLVNFYIGYLNKDIIVDQIKDGKKTKSLFATNNPSEEKESSVKVIGSLKDSDNDPFMGLK